MDFMNRGFRSNQPATQGAEQPTGASAGASSKTKSGKSLSPSNMGNVGKFAFLILLVVLVVLALFSMIMFKGNFKEDSFVDKAKYQAVFLNGGQVYFGKVSDINAKGVVMDKIYYLRVNQQVQPDANTQANNSNDISLVKLGCELHGPTDRMVINRDQVIFWENLKDDGQVTKAIGEYIKQYPNGQPCETQNNNGASNNNNSSSPASTSEAPKQDANSGN